MFCTVKWLAFFWSWIMLKFLRMPLDNWQSASLAAGLLITDFVLALLGVNLRYFWYVCM